SDGIGRSVPSCVEGSKVSGSSSNSDMICLLCLRCHSSSYARLRLREELAQRGHEIELLWDTDALGHAVAVLRNECRPPLAVQPACRTAISPRSRFAEATLFVLDDDVGGEKADQVGAILNQRAGALVQP